MFAPGHPLQLALGLLIWANWFVVAYGGLSVGCAVAAPDPARGPLTWINAALALVTLATAAWLFWLTWRCWRHAQTADPATEHGGFIAPVAAGGHLLAALSTVAVGAPLVLLPPCI